LQQKCGESYGTQKSDSNALKSALKTQKTSGESSVSKNMNGARMDEKTTLSGWNDIPNWLKKNDEQTPERLMKNDEDTTKRSSAQMSVPTTSGWKSDGVTRLWTRK